MSNPAVATTPLNIFSLMHTHRTAANSEDRAAAMGLALEGAGMGADAACRFLRDNLNVAISRASSPSNDNAA